MKLTIRQIDNALRLCTLDGEIIEGEIGLEVDASANSTTTATVQLLIYADDGKLMGPFSRKDGDA